MFIIFPEKKRTTKKPTPYKLNHCQEVKYRFASSPGSMLHALAAFMGLKETS